MNYFSVFGTIGRREYWIAAIMLFLLAGIGVFLLLNDPTAIIGIIMLSVIVWVGTALATKRIRDGGCSGWFVILYCIVGLIPYAGLVAQIVWMCLPTGFWDRYNNKPQLLL